VAGLTVPYVKRIEDRIGVPDVVEVLRAASRQISEALGASLKAEKIQRQAKQQI